MRDVSERFFSKVMPEPMSGCYLWEASVGKDGYGTFKLRGKNRKAHRVAYVLSYGPVSRADVVCHKCDNRACVNPGHLFLGSHRDNMKDMTAKGRQAKGGRCHLTKLSAASVLEIYARAHNGEPHLDIARDFGIGRRNVSEIKRGKTWNHLTGAL